MAMNGCHTVPLLLPDLLGLRYVGARQPPLPTSSLLLAQATVQEPVVFPCGGCGRDETSLSWGLWVPHSGHHSHEELVCWWPSRAPKSRGMPRYTLHTESAAA